MAEKKVKIREATEFRVIDPQNAVKIIDADDLPNDLEASFETITTIDAFEKTVKNFPDHNALMVKDAATKKWNGISYKEYNERVKKLAKVFIKLGLQRHGTVAVLAFNCAEWFISELAAIYAGGIITGIYTTNSPEACHHILESSRTNILVVDDEKQMEKILKIRHQLPYLKAIIQIHSDLAEGLNKSDGYWRFEDLERMEIDETVSFEFETRLNNVAANECCCIVYTSGTVGNPKGVMLSHDNILWSTFCGITKFEKIEVGNETIVSYLPMSHTAAQLLDVFGCILLAGTVYLADRDAMKGTLFNTILEAKPTIFFTVPRLFEKIHEKMLDVGAQSGILKKSLGQWAKSVSLQHHMNKMSGKPTNSLQYRIASKFILSKVKEALGFQRCHCFITGSAPLGEVTKKYFLSLDLVIIEGYGMSESSIHTMTPPELPSFKTCGKKLPGTKTKIINLNEDGHGEICMKGRHVFMGYINEKEKTEEAIDDERWLHSGDLGYIDENGFVYVTGRLKELIITSGGENIPYLKIEDEVKEECKAVSNAFLIGDQRKFLSMLITLKTKLNEDGSQSDDLAPETIKWLESIDLSYKKLSQVVSKDADPKILQSIQEAISRANKKSISNAQKVQKFAILPSDFSIADGDLTPTMKLKRNVVLKKNQQIIDNFYL